MEQYPMGLTGKHVTPYPFWREYGFKNSAVHRVAYENGKLVAEFGGEKKYRFCDGKTEGIAAFTEPKAPVVVPADRVPFALGRNFKAVPTASTPIFDGKHLVGTKDGMLYIWDGETAYGVVGSYNDISVVFSFDKKQGVKYLGRAHFNIESGLHLNCELSSIAVNEDGTRIAIGSAENMGAAYEIEL